MSNTTPRQGFTNNYVQRESGVGGSYNVMVTKLDVLAGGFSVKSKTTIAQPGSPANGDLYWIPGGATGAFFGVGGNQNKFGLYLTALPQNPAALPGVSPSAGWISLPAAKGNEFGVEDENFAKYYWDGAALQAVAGLSVFSFKAPCRVATLANITLSGLQTIDDIAVNADDRVLVQEQTAAQDNGIYLAKTGAWIRSTDADTSAEVKSGMVTTITEGTINADKLFCLATNNPITLGTTPLSFEIISAALSGEVNPVPDTLVLRGTDGSGSFAGASVFQNDDPASPSATLRVAQAVGSVNASLEVTAGGSAPGLLAYTWNGAAGAANFKLATTGSGACHIVEITADNQVAGTHTGDMLLLNRLAGSRPFTGMAFRLENSGLTYAALDTNGKLGLGAVPAWPLDVTKGATAASAVAYGQRLQQTLTAAANNDVLTALYVNPTFDDASKTGVTHFLQKWLSGGTLKASIDDAGQFLGLGVVRSGAVSTIGSASTYGANAYFLATDIGVAPGCLFRSNGTNWYQVGEHFLCKNTTTITADSGNLVKSAFDTAPTLPNSCLAVGTKFEWGFKENIVDAGSNDGACNYQMLIGSTDVGNLTYAAFGEYNRTYSEFSGEMVVRSLGASGSVLGTVSNYYFTSALGGLDKLSSATATTTDTTGAISPDVKITLSSLTNSPTRVVVEGWIKVSGLVI